ncbi:MAG: hypothetical protein HYT79_11340 [Elusimicrobia bacterium]|nr:hypothetical protein [Elusimicrobiota bacterium]
MRAAALLLILPIAVVHGEFAGRTHFLTHGPGSLEEALGGAAAAYSMGPNALYYNPAGLSARASGITGEYAKLMPQVSYSWLGSAFSLGNNSFGLGIIGLDLGEITRRESVMDAGSPAKSYQRAYLLGASAGAGGSARLGTTLGLLDFVLAGYESKAVFADIGGAVRLGERWSLGAVLKNAYFSGLNFAGSKEVYPPELRLGASLSIGGVVMMGQAEKLLDGSTPRLAAGFGFSPAPGFSLRAGLNGVPRFGFGLTTKNRQFAVDFSWQVRAISPTGRVGLSYFFREDEAGPPENMNPYTELKLRAKTIEAFLSEEAKRLIEEGKSKESEIILKRLLALRPHDQEIRKTLVSMGSEFPVVRRRVWLFGRTQKEQRRHYLRFAVSFAQDARMDFVILARDFVDKWPDDERSELIRRLVGVESGIFKTTRPAESR